MRYSITNLFNTLWFGFHAWLIVTIFDYLDWEFVGKKRKVQGGCIWIKDSVRKKEMEKLKDPTLWDHYIL